MANKRDQERKKPTYTNPKQRAEEHTSGFASTSIKLPDGIKFFSIKSAKPFKIDILPYLVERGRKEKGGNPFSDSGYLHYERTYFAHRGVGIGQSSYVCPRKTFGKKCPICEDIARMRRDPKADGELLKSLEPKERQLFAIIDKTEEEQTIKVWDVSNFLFGKVLDSKIKDADEDDGYENFYRLDEGFTLKCSVEEKSFAGKTFYTVSNIEMKVRPEPLDDGLLDEVPDLDKLLIEVDYDKLKAIYEGVEEDQEDDEDAKPAKRAARPAKADTPGCATATTPKKPAPDKAKPESEEEEEECEIAVGDVVEHEEFGVCEVIKVLEGGKKLDIEDEDGKVYRKVWATEVTPVPDEEEEEEIEEKPKKAAPAKKKAPVEEEDDWETTDEEEEEEEKPKKKTGKK